MNVLIKADEMAQIRPVLRGRMKKPSCTSKESLNKPGVFSPNVLIHQKKKPRMPRCCAECAQNPPPF